MLLRAELARGSIDAAETWAAAVEELAHRYPMAAIKGVASEARSAVLFAQGDYMAAAQQALAAVDCAQRLGSPVATSYARILTGEAFAAAGERAEAVEQLEEALAGLRQFGRPRYEDRAAGALRKLGRAVARRSGEPGTPSGLSGREAEVLALVAKGKTNRDIASDLFLSVRTVDRHMSRIFEKLGVSSRAAAVSAFERQRSSA
jgi:ATP/maltotriose-dependent transcriptional regulator MalT